MSARKQRPIAIDILAFLLAAAVAIYLVILTALAVTQRRMMYFPGGPIGPASSFGLTAAETFKIETSDHQKIVAWYQAPKAGRDLFLFLHGNGGTLATRADLLRRLADDGSGFLAIDYRGYGGSTGSPSEAGFDRDAEAAYAKVRALGYAPERIVLIGESIGTGPAVWLAVQHPIRALVLDSAFSSAAAIAAMQYPMFPVRLLMLDQFDSLERIGKVEAPKLFLHASDDPVIPIDFDRKLYDAAKEPKLFVELPSAAHMVLDQAVGRMRHWLARLPPPHV